METRREQHQTRRGLQPQGWGAESHQLALRERLAVGQELLARNPNAERSAFASKPDRPTRVVYSALGRIEHILICVPPNKNFETGEIYSDEVDRLYARHFQALIGALGSNRRYTVVCGLRQESAVRDWFAAQGVPESNLQLAFSRFDYSIWAQDAYVALINPKETFLCEGVRFLRNDDMVIADDIAAQTSVGRLQSILEFQGGNILGSPSGHLIGADYIDGNVGRVGLETKAKVVEAFEGLLGGPVRPIGLEEILPDSERRGGLEGIRQPIFHIDMYVTMTGVEREGREVVLVGSPRLARRVLGQPERPSDQDLYFDQAAVQLEQWHYVKRIPLLPVWGRLWDWDDTYYSLTWNNVVLENYWEKEKNERLVYLPQYEEGEDISGEMGVDPAPRRDLDQEARRIWKEELGFKVISSDGLEDLAYSRGAVHCMTKVLRRSELTDT